MVAVVVVAVLAVTRPWAGTAWARRPTVPVAPRGPSAGPDAEPVSVDTAALVAAVPAEAVGKIAPVRLKDGVVPPTNRWYSGLVFGDQAQPVFAEPLSFGLTDSGFTLGLPEPTTTEKTIMAPHVPAVTVDAGATSAQISAADPVSVTIELLDASGAVLGHVVLAEGSPFVSFTAAQDVTVTSSVTGGSFAAGEHGAQIADAGTSTWGLVGGEPDGASTSLSGGSTRHVVRPADRREGVGGGAARDAAAHPVTGWTSPTASTPRSPGRP